MVHPSAYTNLPAGEYIPSGCDPLHPALHPPNNPPPPPLPNDPPPPEPYSIFQILNPPPRLPRCGTAVTPGGSADVNHVRSSTTAAENNLKDLLLKMEKAKITGKTFS